MKVVVLFYSALRSAVNERDTIMKKYTKKQVLTRISIVLAVYISLWLLTWFVGSINIYNTLEKRVSLRNWELFRQNSKELVYDMYNTKTIEHTTSIKTVCPFPFLVQSKTIDEWGGKYGFCIHTYWIWFFGYTYEISSSTEWLHKVRFPDNLPMKVRKHVTIPRSTKDSDEKKMKSAKPSPIITCYILLVDVKEGDLLTTKKFKPYKALWGRLKNDTSKESSASKVIINNEIEIYIGKKFIRPIKMSVYHKLTKDMFEEGKKKSPTTTP